MFEKEEEMSQPVKLWLESIGMIVKSEFTTPWGMCDLVGLRFNEKHVANRIQLKQKRPISSLSRARIFLTVPDSKQRRSVSIESLSLNMASVLGLEKIREDAKVLIRDRFLVENSNNRLQKINSWMPLHDRLIAVELKISRIEEALNQAFNNLGFTDESYVGFPEAVATRIGTHQSRWERYFDAGVGLLSVTRDGCREVIKAKRNSKHLDKALQMYSVEKFWNTRVKGS